jgi:hypothetical protein
MLNIKDANKFGQVIAGALAKVEMTITDPALKSRWINAIAKAVYQIQMHGEFMTYDEAENYLLIWSHGSNEVYSANGVCQCKAFARGLPCWHRSAARLVRIYLELPENVAPEFPVKAEAEITYLPNTREPIRVENYGGVRLPVYR